MVQTPNLLAMDFVAWMPRKRVPDLPGLLKYVQFQFDGDYKSAWIRGALDRLSNAGIITREQCDSAREKLQKAVNLPYRGNTPNARACPRKVRFSNEFVVNQ